MVYKINKSFKGNPIYICKKIINLYKINVRIPESEKTIKDSYKKVSLNFLLRGRHFELDAVGGEDYVAGEVGNVGGGKTLDNVGVAVVHVAAKLVIHVQNRYPVVVVLGVLRVGFQHVLFYFEQFVVRDVGGVGERVGCRGHDGESGVGVLG